MIYALTLTASPHKNNFKKLSWSQQEQKYTEFFNSMKIFFTDFIYVFETCKTRNIRHAHLIIQPMYEHPEYNCDDIMFTIFRDTFILQFGYERNPIEYSYLIKPILSIPDYHRWEEYIYKTKTPIKIVG